MDNISVQLYSLRDSINGDIEGMFQKLSDMGYHGVELAGDYGKSAAELGELLKKYSLKLSGSHTGIDAFRADFEGVTEFFQALGCTDITVPHYGFPDEETILALAAEMQEYAVKLKSHGITLSYHNHGHEFARFGADNRYGLDILLDAAPDVYMELDTCWSTVAGVDTPAYIRKYGSRCRLLHIKDMVLVGGNPSLKAVGDGEVDIKAIVAAGKEVGVKWFVVENDEPVGDAFEDVRKSINYLKGL